MMPASLKRKAKKSVKASQAKKVKKAKDAVHDKNRYGTRTSEAFKKDSKYMKENPKSHVSNEIQKLRNKQSRPKALSYWEGVKRLRKGNPDY
jgi:hypothetical protein